jgi:hypothetical protein
MFDPSDWEYEVAQRPPEKDWGLNRVKYWDLKLSLFPRKCYLSGKNIWGKYAYYGYRYLHGPDEPIVQRFWIDKHEFLIWQLRK